MTRRAVALLTLSLAACGAPEPATIELANPQALSVGCASPPAEMSARLWVSGYDEPFALVFDATAGTTTGTAEIAPGVVRKLTVDWFAPLGREDGVDLVLAQAQGDLSLVDHVEPTAEFAFTAESVLDAGCKDMRKDSFVGSPTVHLDGADVPVCDLDDSCAGGNPAACTNLVESCSGSDPLDRLVEP